LETARRLLNETIETNEARVPKAAARLEAGFEDVIAVMACLSGTGSASGRLMAWSGSTRRFACRFDKNLQKIPLVFFICYVLVVEKVETEKILGNKSARRFCRAV
jgi:hypothetical protein